MLPEIINITEAKVNDRYGLTSSIYPKGTIIVEGREYFDYNLILKRINAENVFVKRIKNNTVYTSI